MTIAFVTGIKSYVYITVYLKMCTLAFGIHIY